MPRPVCATGVQPFRDLDPQADQQQANKNKLEFEQSESDMMNGKILVMGISLFFLLFFVIESWLMRGIPH